MLGYIIHVAVIYTISFPRPDKLRCTCEIQNAKYKNKSDHLLFKHLMQSSLWVHVLYMYPNGATYDGLTAV